MLIVSICREMGWTYEEYLEQPLWFLELLKDQLEIDADNQRKQMSKAKTKKK